MCDYVWIRNKFSFIFAGIGGHGGTGIHADKKDKYREIIQRISQYATPDSTRCNDTETEVESKKSQFIDQDMLSSPYSHLEFGDRYSTTSSINSLLQTDFQTVPLRAYNQQAFQDRDGVETYRPVEQVSVQQCRICTIL